MTAAVASCDRWRMKLQILHLEDNRDDVELVRHSLMRQGLDFELHAVTTSQEYLWR